MDFTVYDYKRVTSMVIHSMVWIDTSYESFMQKNANTVEPQLSGRFGSQVQSSGLLKRPDI